MAYSKTTYTGDGSTRTFSIGFDYINRADLTIRINGAATAAEFINTDTIRFSVAPPSGSTVEIERATNIADAAVDFVDGSTLTGDDLDKSAKQVLFAVQEVYDDFDYWVQWVQQNAISGGGGEGGTGIHLPPVTSGNQDSFIIVKNSVWSVQSLDDTKRTLGIDPSKTIGSAAYVNVGTAADQVPLAGSLGAAAYKGVGTSTGQIPLFDSFGSAAFKTAGSSIGNVPLVVDVGGGTPGLPSISGLGLSGVLHSLQYCRFDRQVTYNTNGGSYGTAKTWVDRDLTHKIADETGLCVVAGNGSVTVPPGTYMYRAKTAMRNTGASMCRLNKYEDGVTAEVARSSTVFSGSGTDVPLEVSGKVTVGANWGALSIESFGETANATNTALGSPHNSSGQGNNIYATLELWRIS